MINICVEPKVFKLKALGPIGFGLVRSCSFNGLPILPSNGLGDDARRF